MSFVSGYYGLKGWPDQREIDEQVLNDPEQELINERSFTFEYEGSKYQLTPRANYSIQGLVVTHNNVAGIGDAYHTSKSVDLKDLCLVWGKNAVSPHLKDMTFWSEPWTCFVRAETSEAYADFAQDKLSNTHLLASTNYVRDTIRKIKIGDQVQMRGLLVDYYPHGASEALRKTSLVRDDTGNGACEVLYVEDIKIIREWKPFSSSLYQNGKFYLIVFLCLKVAAFLILPWVEYKYY